MKQKLDWTPITKNIKEAGSIVDNELENSIRQLSIFSKAHLFGLKKVRGFPLHQVLFSVLIWPLLGVPSLNFFCGNRLAAFLPGGKDVLYDFLKKQTINWRGFRFHVAKQVYIKHEFIKEKIKGAVFDDSIKHRRGKNVTGASTHFDHTLCKNVLGQQMLELGCATPKGYASLDSQIYVSNKNAQEGKTEFEDKRSAVAKDYKVAVEKNKNEMLRSMLKRAVRAGIEFTHCMADSWFGNKENIKAVLSLGIVAIFRMKRGNMQYKLNGAMYTATELYALVKRRMKRIKGMSYRMFALNVELNISKDDKKPEWINVKLLFSSSIDRKKENWVVFLSTDTTLTSEEILEVYSLRWSVEVYFKEIKQHFGFLKEQTGDYTVHYASIHLCAIRYMLIANSMMSSGKSFGTIRSRVTGRLEMLTFARLLWELFKALICGALDSLKNKISKKTIELIKNTINGCISKFLSEALQLDLCYVDAELKAEAMGAL